MDIKEKQFDWDWQTTSKTNWWQLDLREVWGYRNLLARLVRRDFLLSYQQTLLGPLWTLLQPLLTVFTYVLVFSKLVGISTGTVPPVLFYLTGTILWGLFNDVFTGTSTTFTTNADLFSKVYFPRLVMPFAFVSAQLLRLLVQLALLAAFLIFYSFRTDVTIHMNAWALALPGILIVVAILGLAGGLIFSVITAKYRDLMNIVPILMRILMYVTPVIYPMNIIPVKVRWILAINPMTPMFELFRYGLLGEGSFTSAQLVYSLVCTVVCLLVGLFLFNKQKDALMDIL
ncbi:ABC transporter permease [Spirosoma fluviale]|uniref:Transport permease protein n=1 Tax=Spirosoma fluviale TaxID=1597977 RepID=A0A286FJ39_9BACT|nr:ABC transporter permease [Spirosoma fluviale]SOD82989.1 lipopolysaccharide transport system permease protein [Spirosoma fluviale]